jgi:hypothetical protein
LAAVAAVAGCGASGQQAPAASQLPLLRGARIVAQSHQCDKGANAYCATELVVVDEDYKNSNDLVNAEHDLIHQAGWNGVTADTGNENAAESPGNKYRVTYSTASGDLTGIDLGWIHRSKKIAYALSRSLFAHQTAMSMLLQAGEAS